MAVGESTYWLAKKQDIIHIIILLVVALGIGIYLIATTVLIAKDGTFYIELAKRIAENPVEAMRNISCWGYPFLIYLMHKMTGLFYDATSLQGWIISAQVVSLISKVIASIALYFVGSYVVGSRLSFWGVLILSLLPDSAEFGSDVLKDWPHLMFLTTGFLLLLLGSQYHKNWMFGYAGIIAGLGYLVRSECCQLVLYGSAWLLFNLIRPQGKTKRTKATGALILLLAGFAVIAIPYMRSKGYVFPVQGIWKLPAFLSFSNDNYNSIIDANMCLAGLSVKGIIGNETLITNMCETLVYYFVPGLLIGCFYYFRKQSKTLEQTFFSAAFIVVYVGILLWQSSCREVLSRRYTLALVAFTIFYIPVGLHVIAGWLSKKTSKGDSAIEKNIRLWFFMLMAAGFCVCAAKLGLTTPLRWEKQGYRDAAEWLSKNTTPADIIAIQDNRIVFYAERRGLEYDKQIPEQANYIVRIVNGEDEKPFDKLKAVSNVEPLGFGKDNKEEYSTWMNSKKSRKVVIYKVIH
jgi:4-amino-4-deoxy-L-arabinose transferase-like glycosyltransferase